MEVPANKEADVPSVEVTANMSTEDSASLDTIDMPSLEVFNETSRPIASAPVTQEEPSQEYNTNFELTSLQDQVQVGITEADSVLQSEIVQTGLELQSGTENHSELLGETNSQSELLAETEPQSELLGETESQSELLGETESQSELLGETESQSELLGEIESQPELLCGIEAESELLGDISETQVEVPQPTVETLVEIVPKLEDQPVNEFKSESALEVENAVAQLIDAHEEDKQVDNEQHIVIHTTEAEVVHPEQTYTYVSEANDSGTYFIENASEVTPLNGVQDDVHVMLVHDEGQHEVIEADSRMEVAYGDVQVREVQDNLNEDEVEILEEIIDQSAIDNEKVAVNIPCHVLGRNIDNPLEDPVKNGRILLKPRLGVKIPYRNLTSQIVSKQEIADEIMERSRKKLSTAEPPAGGDFFFTKRLTQRLAKRLYDPLEDAASASAADESDQNNSSKSETIEKVSAILSDPTPSPMETNDDDDSNKITNNSDLIALLEGDDDLDWTPGKSKSPKKGSAEWEREVALKQLRELPKSVKNIAEKVENGTKNSTRRSQKESKEPKQSTTNDDINILPRFSSSSVVKTYTRKRKPSEDIQAVLSAQALKKSAAASDQKNIAAITLPVGSPPQDKTTRSPSDNKQTSSPKRSVTKEASSSELKEKKESLKENKKRVSSVGKTSEKPSGKTSETPAGKSPDKLPEKTSEKPVGKTPDKPSEKTSEKPVGKTSEKPPGKTSEKPLEQTSEKSSEKTTEVILKVTDAPKGSISPNTYISKSSRVVKRKKIWDPDEITSVKTPLKSPKLTESAKLLEKKNKTAEKLKLEKAKVAGGEKKAEAAEKSKVADTDMSPPSKPEKKIPGKKSALKKKGGKRLTEVDRLLMDEGAVNLLYSVKNTDDSPSVGKGKKNSVISLDRCQRELLNKTNEIKNDLQLNSTKDSPISLRKKDGNVKSPAKDTIGPILHRKISKDSATGSVHSPPASPAFEYSDRTDGSRLIRRHSNSSFSSENSDDESLSAKIVKAKSESAKKRHKGHDKQNAAVKESSIGVDKNILNEEMSKNFNKPAVDDPKYSKYQLFSVRKFDHLVQIILSPTSSNGQSTLSLELLTELIEVLGLLEKDNSCRVVLVSSSGSSFCQGLDYKELYSDVVETRIKLANTYATAMREFLVTLAKFSKLLVAGVHGATIGLGVTMLPLFDMVLASDTATFSTPYTRLGCPAEGGMLLTLPHIMHNSLASELFFASRKLTAAEGLRQGLVTRTLWPDKFQEELISTLKVISNQSLQSMQAIKKQLRYQLLLGVESALAAETPILVEHWLSKECQDNFSNFSLEVK